jgi:hypothetical protein
MRFERAMIDGTRRNIGGMVPRRLKAVRAGNLATSARASPPRYWLANMTYVARAARRCGSIGRLKTRKKQSQRCAAGASNHET